jgi:hypothetical protein
MRIDNQTRNRSKEQRKAVVNSWLNPEIRARRIAGIKNAIKNNRWMVGNKNHFKGDDIGYGGLHDWITKYFGQPRFCEHCGSKTKKKYEWASIRHQYKRERTCWLRLCTSCHRKYDLSNFELP